MHIALVGPCSPRALADVLGADPEAVPEGYARTPVDELARALCARGFRVSVVTAEPGRQQAWSRQSEKLAIYCLPYRKSAKSRVLDLFEYERRALSECLSGIDFDIVHSHWTYEFSLAALDVDREALVTAHDAPLTTLRQYRDIYRLSRLALAARVRLLVRNFAFVSPYLARRWEKEMRWRGSSLILPNMAPALVQKATSNSSADVRHKDKIVLSLGNSDPRKNIRQLLQCWPLVLAVHPTAQLRLAGKGLAPTDYLATAFSGNLTNVSFLGNLDKVAVGAELRNASVLVHPSLEECHPVAILEAMKAQLPVVAGRKSGGVPWTVGDSAVLTDVGDPKSISAAIDKLLGDPNLSASLGRRASIRAEELFSCEAVIDKHIQLYKMIAKSP